MLLALRICKNDYFAHLLHSLDVSPGSLETAWIEFHLFLACIMFPSMDMGWGSRALISPVIKKPKKQFPSGPPFVICWAS